MTDATEASIAARRTTLSADYRTHGFATTTLDASIREQLTLVLEISSGQRLFLCEYDMQTERARLAAARHNLNLMIGAKVYLDGWYSAEIAAAVDAGFAPQPERG
ncbi:hypothetical protein CNY89_02095 [Amaricoccus sp. HAR-UPW-R2A-40]|nr:hypothetical protein CNY89_02095 [Amaricoccus sp. HAR-UPW-R2A-40]